jgi:hypothetical protein
MRWHEHPLDAPERVELLLPFTDADRCSGDPEAASYRSVSRPRVIRPRPPSPSDERPERPELEGLRVNTLTGAEFTATPGIPELPMAGWLSPDGVFWPCPENAHLRLAAHIAARLGQHTDEDEVQNAPGPWLERTGWVHFDAEGLPCRIDEPDYTQAQLDTMFDLAKHHEPMRQRLIRELARVGAGDG